MNFHAHVYYDFDHRDEAVSLREALIEAGGDAITVYGLIDRLVGPHMLPMFEVDFGQDIYGPLTAWLEDNHGNLPILVHPLTPDEIANHGRLALWIGQELPINWPRLGVAA